MKPRAFIIHGRDTDAVEELVRFLTTLGVEHLSFDDVASSGTALFIADIVVKGISAADVVIALFTPDEQAALYHPRTASYLGGRRGESRWQARPNVLFEAGVALGIARERTILATLGADVELFSDVSGVHVIDLSLPSAKRMLHKKLSRLFPDAELDPISAESPDAGDFVKVLRVRWPHYDELATLEQHMIERNIARGGISLRDVLRKAVSSLALERQSIERVSPKQIVRTIKEEFSDTVADKAYWWLVVYGVFRFEGIKKWFIGDHWSDSIDNVLNTERGSAILEKFSVSNDGLTPRRS